MFDGTRRSLDALFHEQGLAAPAGAVALPEGERR